MGTLKLFGYLRGSSLDVNSLLYVPSIGTFQMSEIHVMTKRLDKNNNHMVGRENGSEGVWELVQSADPARQESLETEAQYDEMNAEQTWPTEQELKDGSLFNQHS